MISYCPLSASSTIWDCRIKGISTSFGVSRFVYNSSHLLYDRISKGHWLPIKDICVNGELEGYEMERYQIIETTWENWRTMFPGSKVMIPPASSSFNYTNDSYSKYKSSDTIFYSVKPLNSGLPMKQKVHGIIIDQRIKVFSYEAFGDSTTIIQDNFRVFP